MRMRSVLKHSAQALAEGALIALLVVGLMAGSVFAAKGGVHGKPGGGGGTTGGGTLALVMVTDANSNGAPNWGDVITFNVSTTATTSPFVSLNCYQGTTWVLSASAGFFDSYPWSKDFYLSSGYWTGGAADCTARLYSTVDGTSTTTLATLSFRAES